MSTSKLKNSGLLDLYESYLGDHAHLFTYEDERVYFKAIFGGEYSSYMLELIRHDPYDECPAGGMSCYLTPMVKDWQEEYIASDDYIEVWTVDLDQENGPEIMQEKIQHLINGLGTPSEEKEEEESGPEIVSTASDIPF